MDDVLCTTPDRRSRSNWIGRFGKLWRDLAAPLCRHRPIPIDPDRWSDAMLRDIGLTNLGRGRSFQDARRNPMDWPPR